MLRKKQLVQLTKNEATADGNSDLGASAPDGYITYGGGVMLNLSNKVNGYISLSETTNRRL